MPDIKDAAVLKAVAEVGYRPDPVARSLAERRTRTIGVGIDDTSCRASAPPAEVMAR